jgi:ABC-2 type transport system ATP-binding protein
LGPIEVRNLTKRYGRLTALRGASFSIRSGEILGLIGPNGSGKTTLFECLAGVLPFDEGAVCQGDRTLTPRERSSILFYLPDAVAPWPAESVRWALDFTVGFFGGRAPARDEVVRRFDLAPILDSAIGSLSKGQRKRALLAIGVLTPQPMLLADEPFEGLDLRQMRDVAAALRADASNGRTLFLSIHQISDAARICDRFILLSGGRVCGEGTLKELSSLAATRTSSPGSPGSPGLPSSPDSTVPARDDLEEVFLALT